MIHCSICRKHVDEEFGHNAQPFAEGRCCSQCNRDFVIPARINREKPPRPEMEVAGLKVLNWLKRGHFKLEKPQGSSMHHMRDYVGTTPLIDNVLDNKMQNFIIEHDWNAVIPEEDGDVILPYPFCSFEFRISGMRCITMFANNEQLKLECHCNFIGCDGVWIPLGSFDIDEEKVFVTHPIRPELDQAALPLFKLFVKQVRSICIMLDADVATKQTIRASEKLNRQREKRGRHKLYDYHVVVLNRKPKLTLVPTDWQTHGERNSPRLHFRRGHYRHFVNHRTWINWQLVGNPDLGFVDKHYRLT